MRYFASDLNRLMRTSIQAVDEFLHGPPGASECLGDELSSDTVQGFTAFDLSLLVLIGLECAVKRVEEHLAFDGVTVSWGSGHS
jgi:hypothetical protein